MKKREPVKYKENVIFFPDLEKRLTEKGLESLQLKRYKEAITLLEDARNLDPENGEILMGLVLAYFEGASFQKAKDLAKELLLKGIGDYFQMVDLYLTILIQLHEYTEIVSTIEALLDEREIPPEKNDHFLTILQFSRRMAENHLFQGDEPSLQQTESESVALNLHSIYDPKEQMLLISSLADKNIRPYIDEIKKYLQDPSGHPFLKTMLLNLLKDQEYDQEVVVEKFKLHKVVIPTQLPDLGAQSEMIEIMEQIKERLENSDPVLFENVKSLVERHYFLSYPFTFETIQINAWAAAFHLIVLEYYGSEPKVSDFLLEYRVQEEEMTQALELIRQIEEISYPII
jgi:tetratricopeptide (TPR) repeat protein